MLLKRLLPGGGERFLQDNQLPVNPNEVNQIHDYIT